MYAQKDTETLVATRLKEPWSAPFFAGSLTNEVAENVISRYDGLEKHVRLRTVLAALSLKKGPQRNLRPSLISLAREAKNDEDEWVRVIGHAVGEFSGPLDMKAVAEEFPQVASMMQSLEKRLQDSDGVDLGRTPETRPLEDAYLTSNLTAAPSLRPHRHFTLRENVGVAARPLFPGQRLAADAGISTKSSVQVSASSRGRHGSTTADKREHNRGGGAAASSEWGREGTLTSSGSGAFASRIGSSMAKPGGMVRQGSSSHLQGRRGPERKKSRIQAIDINEAIEALHQRSGSADASRLDTEREEDAEEGELPPEEPYVSVETEGNELSSKERRRAEESKERKRRERDARHGAQATAQGVPKRPRADLAAPSTFIGQQSASGISRGEGDLVENDLGRASTLKNSQTTEQSPLAAALARALQP
ncbi:hypothetical protein CYMTET_3719 [Cymbomonas tetramitiformis]|uniref:NELF-A N-terminal domain-containing protein n=1 Tax=Cymbomonas tetramitiformis TaxID=36881 RepID=A0AAE0H2X3_9CHLO|nr:hypothetical protein CYMTET_3719 [Cymbomonas tetramitiformis]